MNRKRILGIIALLAVLVLGLTFTACPQVDDGIEREVTFVNHSDAKIYIICEGTPSQFELQKATSLNDDSQRKVVTRTGKDVVLLSISITDPAGIPRGDEGLYIELDSGTTAIAGNTKVKDGLPLKAGLIIFRGARGNDAGIRWDVNTLDE